MSLENIIIIIISMLAIWLGSSVIINTIAEFAKGIKASPFVVSFFLLGSLTSVSELSVAVNSYFDRTLEVSVGNLLGGIIVIFLLIIPVLAIAGNGIKFGHQYSKQALFFTMGSFILPAVFFLDSYLLNREALIIITAYILSVFLLFFSHKSHVHKPQKQKIIKRELFIELSKIIFGALLLLWACDNLINQIMNLASYFQISPFLISFLTLSIGTNLPELSLAIRSVITGNKDIAFGNYLGSATFNLVILSILVFANNRILVNANFINIIVFTIIGMGLFYNFILSKNTLSRREGIILIIVYFLFVLFELFLK